eukprot:gene2381-3186_t
MRLSGIGFGRFGAQGTADTFALNNTGNFLFVVGESALLGRPNLSIYSLHNLFLLFSYPLDNAKETHVAFEGAMMVLANGNRMTFFDASAMPGLPPSILAARQVAAVQSVL